MGSCCCAEKRNPTQESQGNGNTDGKETVGNQAENNPEPATPDSRNISRLAIRRRQMLKRKQVSRPKVHPALPLTATLLPDSPVTSIDKRLILSALQRLFIFKALSEEEWERVTDAMKRYSLKAGQVAYEEGQAAEQFFVLASGKLEMLVNGQVTMIISPGSGFGEIALLHDTPRTATVRAKQDSQMWGLDRGAFHDIVQSINSQQLAENQAFIDSLSIFEVLTKREKENLLAVLVTTKYPAGSHIVTQGESGDVCFIIKEGTVSCQKDGREVRRLDKGEFFGEQALLYGGVRTASVLSVGQVKCVSIGAEDLTKALGQSLQQVIYRNSLRIAFDHNEHLKKLSREQIDKLIAAMAVRSYARSEVVVGASTRLSVGIWVVVKGELARGRGRLIGTFMLLGDLKFEEEGECEEDVVVRSESADVAYISKSDFESTLGGSLALASKQNATLSILSSMNLLRPLAQDHLRRLVQVLNLRSYGPGEFIVKQHEKGDSFFIVESGEVQVIKDGVAIRTIRKMDYFGERAVLSGEERSASIRAVDKVTCWELRRTDFQRLIDAKACKQLLKRIEMQDDSISLRDLIYVKTLGRGTFGIVMLAIHPTTRQLYAVKSINKEKIRLHNLRENLLTERNTLRQLDHAFVVKLVKTGKDLGHLYFVMEYVRGKDLFDALREIEGVLSARDAKFYVACLLLILEYLHDRDIIHRDLKPENIVLDEEGYPKLIDFGTAKLVKGRTYTVIGTPHYMAPEVIGGRGYSVMADYWSVGVLLFEMVCGRVPFGEEEENPVRIYEHILRSKLVYPSWISPQSISTTAPIIETLLNRNPSLRLSGSMERFKKNPWFNDISWVSNRQDELLDREVSPPYVPQLNDMTGSMAASLSAGIPLSQMIEVPLGREKTRLTSVLPVKSLGKASFSDISYFPLPFSSILGLPFHRVSEFPRNTEINSEELQEFREVSASLRPLPSLLSICSFLWLS